MKKFLLANLACLAFAVPAKASDLLYGAPPVRGYNWTGFYGGLNMGYGFGRTGVQIDFEDSHTQGVVAGGQFGYNFQSSPNSVVGLQVQLDGSDIRGHAFDAGVLYNGHVEVFGNATVRGGVLLNPQTLLFLQGGIGSADNRVKVDNFGTLFMDRATHTGPVFGGGIEIAVTPQDRIFFTYNYFDGGSQTYDISNLEKIHVRFSTIMVGVNKPF